MATRRKDRKGRVLREGEYERKNKDGEFVNYAFKAIDDFGNARWIYDKDLKELRVKEKEFVRDVAKGVKIGGEGKSLNDVYDIWYQGRLLDVQAGLLADTSLNNYSRHYRYYVRDGLGNLKIKDIDNYDMEQFFSSLSKQDVALSTIRIVRNVLSQVFDVALKKGWISFNPVKGALNKVERLNSRHKAKADEKTIPDKALTRDEQALFVDFLYENKKFGRWFPLLYFLLESGMRAGEGTGLCFSNVTDEGVYVNHTLEYISRERGIPSHFVIHAPKTGRGKRCVPYIGNMKWALELERERQKKLGIVSLAEVDGWKNFVFVNGNGNLHHNGLVNRALRRIIAACNEEQRAKGSRLLLPNFHLHSLRHTCATRLYEDGVRGEVIQTILGQEDFNFTKEVYISIQRDFIDSELKKCTDCGTKILQKNPQDLREAA